ncbi:hypothetical protein LK533_16660 [Sphingomonas sp. PL-96]|uniref:hypothetical protein n=1 Tax=Sphingomonas sp. PL-96 TaxID=2887201 RepID=UPI001E2AB6B8|nr:hypothetical protein [Sphingomonas sp. PL-96]MCC2978283.1 hypothetical protein [Sphingomonas sp. PL-96]
MAAPYNSLNHRRRKREWRALFPEDGMNKQILAAALVAGAMSTVPQIASAQDWQARHEHRDRSSDDKTRNTIIGAGLGLLGGALLSGGDPWASAAGAAAGGAIGNVTSKDRRQPRYRIRNLDRSVNARDGRDNRPAWKASSPSSVRPYGARKPT